MMKIDAKLIVFLKGADLVAETAYLTLIGKMPYKGRLLALRRFDYFRFIMESEIPERAVSDLNDVLARQSTFYNRNKHGHVLECTWKGGGFREGPEVAVLRERISGEAAESVIAKGAADFDSQDDAKKLTLKENRVFVIDSLVEEQDPAVRSALERKLQSDLGEVPVEVPVSGVMWWFVLSAGDESEARAVAEEILVSNRRDQGLLLNPNFQRFEILSIVEMEPTRDD